MPKKRADPSDGGPPKKKPIGFAMGKVKRSEDGTALLDVGARALKRLGDSSDSNIAFLVIMEADPAPTLEIKKFMQAVKSPEHNRHGLPRIAMETGTPIAKVFESYSRGVKALGHLQVVEAAAERMSARMNDVIDAILDVATPQEIPCDECEGTGKAELLDCAACEGKGRTKILHRFWPYAVNKAIDISNLVEKSGGISLTQNTNVKSQTLNVAAPGEFLAQIATMSDEILNKKPEIVEAQVVGALPAAPSPLIENVLTENSNPAPSDLGEGVLREAEEAL